MHTKPSFSVIIPAYNEEDMIADCIASVKNQDYSGSFEIIVVDNASTDRTAEVAKSLGARAVYEPKQGYVHALRAGFAAAESDIIACTDADTHVPANWLSNFANNLCKDNVVACGGVFTFHDGSWIIHLIGWLFGRLNYHLAGANMAVWRKHYLACGGFDPHVNMGADVQLGQRLDTLGKVIIDRRIVAKTSGRRFQYAFFQTLVLYYVNDIWLLLLKRPLFYNFPNIRIKTAKSAFDMSKTFAARFATALVIIAGFFWITENTENRMFGSVFAHGEQNKRLVALTFDDGPSTYTTQVLDTLDKYNVKATFFMIGANVEKYPDIARRIAADGHVIGNHTFTHPLLAPIETPELLHQEVNKTSTAIQRATGVWPQYFRPPHGWRSPWMMQTLKNENYTVVMWTVSPDDWQHISAETIEEKVVSKTHGGTIILLHDGLELKADAERSQTVKALPSIIASLRARGYTFVTVPELIASSQKAIVQNVMIPPAINATFE